MSTYEIYQPKAETPRNIYNGPQHGAGGQEGTSERVRNQASELNDWVMNRPDVAAVKDAMDEWMAQHAEAVAAYEYANHAQCGFVPEGGIVFRSNLINKAKLSFEPSYDDYYQPWTIEIRRAGKYIVGGDVSLFSIMDCSDISSPSAFQPRGEWDGGIFRKMITADRYREYLVRTAKTNEASVWVWQEFAEILKGSGHDLSQGNNVVENYR
jgi:hypothetical protein